MNLLYRQTCGLVCLAVFTAIALVGCGQATGTKAVDLTPIPDVETLKVGSTHTVSLTGTFSGENLTYSAKSSNEAVATVKVDGVHLTVTGVAPGGPVKITVTATDAQDRSSPPHTFNVTVVKLTTSEPAPGAPTVRTGATDEVNVDQEDTRRITLALVFDGDDLEYDTPSSSRPTVATASISDETLTITALSPGTTTITIVATNDDGNATHRIAVTVPEPGTTPPITTPPTTPQEDCSLSGSSLTITVRIVRENSKRCTLPDRHSLVYSDGEVQVRKDSSATTNVWTITARLKGRHVIQIREDESGDTVGEITVIVPNTPPRLNIGNIDGTDYDGTVTGTVAPKSGTTLHTLTIPSSGNLAAQFTDVDSTDNSTGTGIFNYKVQHKPDALLIKTVRGFLLEANDAADVPPIDAVVLRPFTKSFSIEIYAFDRDNDRSDNPVTVTFASADTITKTDGYDLVKGTGNLYNRTEKIGNRSGVVHNINLIKDSDYDFLDFVTGEEAGRKVTQYRTANTDPHTVLFTECTATIGAFNTGCWKATISGSNVEIVDFTPNDTAPEIDIRLDTSRRLNDASDHTVRIAYYVVSGRDDENLREYEVEGRSFTVDIHRCVDVDDCP